MNKRQVLPQTSSNKKHAESANSPHHSPGYLNHIITGEMMVEKHRDE